MHSTMKTRRLWPFQCIFAAALIAAFGTMFAAWAASARVPSQPRQDGTAPPSDKPKDDDAKLAYVLMTTSKGDIAIELNREKAPISVANFLSYVDKKHYDGTIFHRVMANFMIQGGGFTPDMVQKPTDPTIKNEWTNGLKNTRGTIAMARLGGQPDSASAQFFINVVDNAGLDRPQADGAGYAVFGKVVAGMKAVEAIKAVATTTRGQHQNVPVEPVLIQTVRRIDEADAKKRIEAEKPKKAQ